MSKLIRKSQMEAAVNPSLESLIAKRKYPLVEDRPITILNLPMYPELLTFSQHLDWQGELAAVISRNTVYLADLPAKKKIGQLNRWREEKEPVTCVSLSKNSAMLLIGLWNGKV